MPKRHRHRRRPAAWLLALTCATGGLASRASPASAQVTSAPAPSEITGVVLDIQDDELILDLGSDRHVADGERVEIWRPLKLKHPVTGKLFTDRFLIGTLELVQVRPSMSLSKPVGALSRDPQKGDIVIAASKTPTPSVVPAPTPTGAGTPQPGPYDAPSPEDAEAVALGKIMDDLRGADPIKRIRVYEDYVRTQPKGRFARVLYEEAASLRRVIDLERQKSSVTSGDPSTRAPILRGFTKPPEAVGAAPLRFSVELSDEATGAILHVRSQGQTAYSSTPMAPMGNGYFGVTVPAERVVAPELSYFIEATGARGEPIPVVGGPGAPETIEIQAPPTFAKPRKLDATVALSSDYADYNVGEHNDWAWQTEGYFQLRYGDVGVRAVRTGFGVYRGMGGTIEELDVLGLKPRRVGLTYGYVESEIGVHKLFSFIGRTVIGLDEDGVAGGGQLMIRIGNDRQTNLVLGGELLGGVGLRGITQLELNTFKRFPMLFRIEVTNQPAGASVSAAQFSEGGISTGAGQVGGRGIAQIGWRILDPLVVSVRGSFQGRTIKHAGPGGGAAVSYQW